MTLHAGARRRRVPAASLDPGGSVVVLTATARLSRDLGERHDAEQIVAGRSGWTSPRILPFDAWMVDLWRCGLYSGSLAPPLRLLQPAAEQMVWEDIVRSSAEGSELLEIPRTAEVALDAWNLAHRWELGFDATEWRETEDSEAFVRWSSEFLRRCRMHGWMSRAEVPASVGELIRCGRVSLPEDVIVAGFDDLPPSHQRVLDALTGRGVRVETRDGWWGGPPEQSCARSVRVGFDDLTAEIGAAASWARRSLMALAPSSGDGPDPEGMPRIGVIVPDLHEHRERIERIFSDEFSPGRWLLDESRRTRAFNISLGARLADYPAIECALDVLGLDPNSMLLADAGRLLLSPFLAGAHREFTRRSLLVQTLRRRREPTVGVQAILGLASDLSAPWHCPELAECFRQWHAVRMAHRGNRPPSDWPPVALELLHAIGWPGDRALNSPEFQTIEAWRDLLAELSGLDSVIDESSWSTFVSAARRLTGTRPFQPESAPAPVQILGLLEASGLEFDRLWIMGMDSGAWPRSGGANPFLPASLQRDHGMPDSSPERQLEFARRLCRRLLASVRAAAPPAAAPESLPEVVVSYAQGETAAGIHPSPLFADLPEISAGAFGFRSWMRFVDRVFSASQMEALADEQAPPWKAGSGPVRGGTRVFADQAACPFRAFARARLGAGEPDPVVSGLDAIDRGILVHDVLERVWAALETHERLVSLSSAALERHVRSAVSRAIDSMSERRSALGSPAFREIEQDRLVSLVGRWLDLEKSRRAFRVVEREGRGSIRIGHVPVVVRVDRVDQLEDGSKVLIDYKTRPAAMSGWDGDRLAEPQLPIYASHIQNEQEAISGVFFAIVRKGQERFRGVAVSDEVVGGAVARSGDPPLDERIANWRLTLERLAGEFSRGWAAVDPRDGPATCRHCNLGGLCRVAGGEGSGAPTAAQGVCGPAVTGDRA